jgi:hypothetical protein
MMSPARSSLTSWSWSTDKALKVSTIRPSYVPARSRSTKRCGSQSSPDTNQLPFCPLEYRALERFQPKGTLIRIRLVGRIAGGRPWRRRWSCLLLGAFHADRYSASIKVSFDSAIRTCIHNQLSRAPPDSNFSSAILRVSVACFIYRFGSELTPRAKFAPRGGAFQTQAPRAESDVMLYYHSGNIVALDK